MVCAEVVGVGAVPQCAVPQMASSFQQAWLRSHENRVCSHKGGIRVSQEQCKIACGLGLANWEDKAAQCPCEYKGHLDPGEFENHCSMWFMLH